MKKDCRTCRYGSGFGFTGEHEYLKFKHGECEHPLVNQTLPLCLTYNHPYTSSGKVSICHDEYWHEIDDIDAASCPCWEPKETK